MEKFRSISPINLFLSILIFCSGYSQKEISVKNVSGEASGNDSYTIAQIKETALENAKINALRRAGVVENIISYDQSFQQDISGVYNDFYISQFQSEMKGAIKSYELIDMSTSIGDFKNVKVDVEINAVVIKYKNSYDPKFQVKVSGIKPVYEENSNLNFKINSSINCYLYMFYFNENDSSIFFPNKYDEKNYLSSNIEHSFPRKNDIKLVVQNNQSSESNSLIFVFTKEKYPFLSRNNDGMTTKEEIFNWIFSILPEKRRVVFNSLTILEKN